MHDIDSGGQVTLQWQWSLDGESWNTGGSIGTARAATGDYSDAFSAASELQYWCRVVVKIEESPTPSSRKTAVISVFGHWKYV